MPALMNVVEDFNPHIIQVFGSENIYGLIAGHCSVPVVLHVQGILTTCLNTFYHHLCHGICICGRNLLALEYYDA